MARLHHRLVRRRSLSGSSSPKRGETLRAFSIATITSLSPLLLFSAMLFFFGLPSRATAFVTAPSASSSAAAGGGNTSTSSSFTHNGVAYQRGRLVSRSMLSPAVRVARRGRPAGGAGVAAASKTRLSMCVARETGEDDPQVSMLHQSARLATKAGRLDWARQFYHLVLYSWRSPPKGCAMAHTYLLLALLEQKVGDMDAARRVFIEGSARAPECARLFQAWALFEYKQGNGITAKCLAERAVHLDGNLRPLLRWKIWRDLEDIPPRDVTSSSSSSSSSPVPTTIAVSSAESSAVPLAA